MNALLCMSLLSTAFAAPPAPDAAGPQKAAWTGLGMSAAGTTMIVAGGFGFYDGPLDAINRQQGQRDKLAGDPGTALVSGVVVGGGLGLSAIGSPILSVGSTLAATRQQAAGGAVSPTLGWVSVGSWAAGMGAYLAAQSTGSTTLDWTWVAMRGTSFGTGLAQLLQTGRSMNSQASRPQPPTRQVRLVVGPSSGAGVGTF